MTKLLEGLKNKSPKAPGGSDLPTKMPGHSTVNENSTRDSVAPTPKTLGPRDA